ncbi:MAG: hypothetical protein IPM79_11035 [Polyangiaceae bacterium]|nr:hypothetical protein [Polyangiaceae bacterium]MBK8938154.1 hypothetical protein [Polyangiaceae bacterium]
MKRALVPATLAALLAVGCVTEEDKATVEFACPSDANWPVVSQSLERTCGTLDCHGDRGRPFRLFGRSGARLDDGDVVGETDGTSPAELRENLASACGLEPEQMAAVVAGEEDPQALTLVRKPLLIEAHKGGRVWLEDSPGYLCLLSWIEGSVDLVACNTDLETP